MKILAVEFSSEQRSVAVVERAGATVHVRGAAREIGGRNAHAVALIEEALQQAKIEREEIECIAVGLGPGSYTGIRAAIALAQGWQLARAVKSSRNQQRSMPGGVRVRRGTERPDQRYRGRAAGRVLSGWLRAEPDRHP